MLSERPRLILMFPPALVQVAQAPVALQVVVIFWVLMRAQVPVLQVQVVAPVLQAAQAPVHQIVPAHPVCRRLQQI